MKNCSELVHDNRRSSRRRTLVRQKAHNPTMGNFNITFYFSGYLVKGIGKIVQNWCMTTVGLPEGVHWYVEGVISQLWAILTSLYHFQKFWYHLLKLNTVPTFLTFRKSHLYTFNHKIHGHFKCLGKCHSVH